MLEKTGIPTQAEIDSVFPCEKRLLKGPVAIIECFQPIPCDPCATACPRGAILPFKDINDRPDIDNDKCIGCIICMTRCPGLAIMVVDMTWSDDRALIKMPYEFRPLPEKGETVQALDREGKVVALAEVAQVQNNKNMNKVPIVSIIVDKELVKIVRNIRVLQESEPSGNSHCVVSPPSPASEPVKEEPEDSGIACRCNDLDLAEIRNLITRGYTSIPELKQMARLGMGPCQGRNCLPIVVNELSRALNIPVAELSAGSFRPMVKSIKLGELAAYNEEEVV